MKIMELQVQLNTAIQILQADKYSFKETLQLVRSQPNEQFRGQIIELHTQLNSSNQLIQDQLSGIPVRFYNKAFPSKKQTGGRA